MVEVPITFVERRLGVSKMSAGIVLEAMRRVTVWGIQRRFTPSGKPSQRPAVAIPGQRTAPPATADRRTTEGRPITR